MPLTKEDGTGTVSDANVYADVSDVRAYATDRGVTLDPDDTKVSAWIIKATDYLQSLDWKYERLLSDQPLDWPRKRDICYIPSLYDPIFFSFPCGEISSDATIWPQKQLIAATAQLVMDQANGIDLQPSTAGGEDGRFVTEERVDVITTRYSEKLGTLSTPTLRVVDAILKHLVVSRPMLRSVRV